MRSLGLRMFSGGRGTGVPDERMGLRAPAGLLRSQSLPLTESQFHLGMRGPHLGNSSNESIIFFRSSLVVQILHCGDDLYR